MTPLEVLRGARHIFSASRWSGPWAEQGLSSKSLTREGERVHFRDQMAARFSVQGVLQMCAPAEEHWLPAWRVLDSVSGGLDAMLQSEHTVQLDVVQLFDRAILKVKAARQ